jgi:hypothetical protein
VAVDSIVYFAPFNQNNVGVLDTATSTFSTITTTGDAASGNSKYHFAVAVGSVVYFGPHNQNNVGVLDTATSTFSTIATTGDAATGNYKYVGAVAVGRVVYSAPYNQNNVGVLTLPPPSPSTPPPPDAPGSSAGISGDPHIKGAHGEEADFKGEHRAVYNALSAKNISLNLLIEHDNFHTPYSRLNVHGSWVKAAFHTVRTSRKGRVLHIGYHAIDPPCVIITEGCAVSYCNDTKNARRHVLHSGAPKFTAENVEVSLRDRTLSVTNGQWLTTTRSARGVPHAGTRRLNIEVKTTYAVTYDNVAPHGVRCFRAIESQYSQNIATRPLATHTAPHQPSLPYIVPLAAFPGRSFSARRTTATNSKSTAAGTTTRAWTTGVPPRRVPALAAW